MGNYSIKIGLNKINSTHLRLITQAGGKLKEKNLIEIINFCKKNDINLVSMYGQTEASPRISYLPWNDSESKIGSIGKSIPGGKMWLEDSTKKKITKCHVIGELIYKGKNVFLGYASSYKDLNHHEQNKSVLRKDLLGR